MRWVASLVSLVILGFSATAGQERTLVLEGGTLIDGTGSPPVADAVVVVEGARIKAVGARGQVDVSGRRERDPGSTVAPSFPG